MCKPYVEVLDSIRLVILLGFGLLDGLLPFLGLEAGLLQIDGLFLLLLFLFAELPCLKFPCACTL